MLRKIGLLPLVIMGFAVWCAQGALAADAVVRQFSAGATATTVGIAPASEDVELTGPQALTSDADGNLFVLDQINGRILRFNPKQSSDTDPGVLKMPADVQPNDLIVRKSDILVWDGSIRTLKAGNDQSTRGIGSDVVQLEEVVTRGTDDPIAVSAFAQMGSQAPGSSAELLDQNTRAAVIKKTRQPDRQYIASRGKGSVIADVIPSSKNDSSVRIEVQTMDTQETIAQLSLRVPHKLGTVEFLEIDNNDRFYVLGEDVPDSSQQPSTFVARYAPSGALEGVYELPLENTPVTRRFVTVSGTGDVYFLRTNLLGVDVVAVGFRPLKNASVIDRRLPRTPRTFINTIFDTISAAVRPASRQQAIETAFAFEGVQWRLTPANYGGDPDMACSGFSRIRRPWYLQGKVNQEVRGVPYCWGCHGSLANFRQRIEAGTKAGNVCTHDAPRADVAGVDCSGFVSAAWGLSVHYTTAAIPSIAKALDNPWDLKPGDALNKPGSHVMLFLRFTPDRKAEVMEASTGGCNGRVCRNVYPLASLLQRGYVPVRFRALAADETAVPVGAYQEPESQSGRAKKSGAAKRQTGDRG
jgi:hypothetical protein